MNISVSITHHNPNPNTIWNKLAARLGRAPTNAECKEEIKRILCNDCPDAETPGARKMKRHNAKPSNFRAYEWAQGPLRQRGAYVCGVWTNYAMADATDKYLALSGRLLRACKNKVVSARHPTPADKHYDQSRAETYYKMLTGRDARGVVWSDQRVHGENRPRIRFIIDDETGEKWEVPHWDWNGHNAKIDDCQVHELADIFA